jgi:starch synthase
MITVHNLAFQGLFGRHTLAELGLPAQAWAVDGVEFHGHLSFLKGGLQHANWITTVSPSYAREIQIDAEGMGLAGLLRWRGACLTGILNGVDTQIWNPGTDAYLAASYGVKHLDRKAINKTALQKAVGLEQREDMPLLGVVSRLTWQKGIDLLPPLEMQLAGQPVQLVVLGSGEPELERALLRMADNHPGQIAVKIGFDEGLAHRIEAGADIFLMPSRFEPCGLNQMYSLRYGTPPIVRNTGGLADTVIDCLHTPTGAGGANGFVFTEATSATLLATIRRATDAWSKPRIWRQLQANGMSADLGWSEPARRYAALYQTLSAQDH